MPVMHHYLGKDCLNVNTEAAVWCNISARLLNIGIAKDPVF